MTVLNEASSILLGDTEIQSVYLGTDLIWTLSSSDTIEIVDSAVFNSSSYSPGIFDILGSRWGAVARGNVVVLGGVALTSSNGSYGSFHAYNEAYPLRAATDGLTSGSTAITDNVSGTIICWDFGGSQRVTLDGGYFVYPRTGFAEYWRSWVIEISLDGTSWTAVDTRSSDMTMSSVTWTPYTFTDPGAIFPSRFVRVRSTGNSSAGYPYMGLQEIEFYGDLTDVQPVAMLGEVDLTYRSGPMGVIEYLGKLRNTTTVESPEDRGLVVTTVSGRYSQAYASKQMLLTSSPSLPSIINNITTGWWQIDFGPWRQMRAERYRMGARSDYPDMPYKWIFKGSNDKTTWDILDDHSSVITENNYVLGGTSILTGEVSSTFYRYFRIDCLSGHTSGDAGLHSLEIYGIFKEEEPALASGFTRLMPSTLSAYNGIVETLSPTVTVSSTLIGTAAATVDQSLTSTGWISTDAVNEWLQLDFGTHQVLPHVFALEGRADQDNRHPLNFVLESSSDASTWTTVYTSSPSEVSERWVYRNLVPFFVEPGSSAKRYWRIRNTGVNILGDNFLCIGEIEMWGDYI